MKRFGLIFIGALAMLMAGCSKDVPQTPEEDAWVNDLSLPVPIEFGAVELAPATKADTIGIDDVANLKFGVFAVDVSEPIQTGAESELLHNVYATYNRSDAADVPSTLKFSDNGSVVTYYYPYGSLYNYSFFAYHLRQSNNNFRTTSVVLDTGGETGTGYYVDVNMGESDILWASSHAEPFNSGNPTYQVDGFNAKFLRYAVKNGTYAERKPKLEFSHVTVALNFIFKVDTFGSEAIPAGTKVKSVQILNTASKAEFCVAAHEDYAARAGKLNALDSAGVTMTFNKALDSQNMADLGYMFLVPPDGRELNARMVVSVPKKVVAGQEPEFDDVTVELKLTVNTEPFRAGYIYKYVVTLSSLVKVEADVSLVDWKFGYIGNDTTGTIAGDSSEVSVDTGE